MGVFWIYVLDGIVFGWVVFSDWCFVVGYCGADRCFVLAWLYGLCWCGLDFRVGCFRTGCRLDMVWWIVVDRFARRLISASFVVIVLVVGTFWGFDVGIL